MNELKPKLFDVLKDYSKEQAMRDVISGIIVAIIALAAVCRSVVLRQPL